MTGSTIFVGGLRWALFVPAALAARAAIELLMDEIRRITGRQDDGDALIRNAIGVGRQIGIASNEDDSERSITEGLKLILQGLYKGVRNPVARGCDPFPRLETLQILSTCSFLLSRMQMTTAGASTE